MRFVLIAPISGKAFSLLWALLHFRGIDPCHRPTETEACYQNKGPARCEQKNYDNLTDGCYP
jgi:hypothetical protein